MEKRAAYVLGNSSSKEKNKALENIASKLIEKYEIILDANKIDTDLAKKKGISESLLDRLTLTEERIRAMAKGVSDIVKLDDPVGEVTSMKLMENGLKIGVQRVPIGTIGIIYEARPNVTADAAALCLKTGNAVILRGEKRLLILILK